MPDGFGKASAPRRMQVELHVLGLRCDRGRRVGLERVLRLLRRQVRVDGVERRDLIDDQPVLLAELRLELADERVQRLLRRDEVARARSA